jgi:CBS domain-containing protein
MLTTTVQQMLSAKGAQVWSVPPESTVYDALQLMAEKNIGGLMVLDGGSPVGIFTERDYARKVVLQHRTSRETQVGEVMTTRVLGVSPDQTAEECMALMSEKHVRHLPVMSAERLVGIISIGDIVKAVVDEQRFVIRQLENYITGGR